MNEIPISTYTEQQAWDVIWKWKWFVKETWQADFRKSKEGTRRALSSLLPRLNVKSVLDCSCGLGWKTILLTELGYEVEGSDASAIAVECASQLAKEEGMDIRFFRSRWEKLDSNSIRKYDCIYNDAFAWVTSRESLEASARGIYSVLNKGGKFIFQGAHQWSEESDKERRIEEDLDKEGRFEIFPPYEKDGLKLIVLIAREKTPDGILGNRIHIIEEHGEIRVEIASIFDLFKWTWQDYVSILKSVGFREIYSVKEKGVSEEPYILNIGVK